MVTDEERLKASLDEKWEEAKIEAVKAREAKERDYESKCLAAFDLELQPYIKTNQEELEKIRKTFREREKEINDAKWEDNQNFLRQQELIRGKEKADAENELESTKSHYEEQILRLNLKEAELDQRITKAEAELEAIFAKRVQLASESIDIENGKNGLEQDLEMDQRRERMRITETHLEKREKINKDFEQIQEGLLEKTIQRQKETSNKALTFQKTLVEVSLLDLSSEQITDVNNSINKGKELMNQITSSYDELSVPLLAMDRAKNEVEPKINNCTMKLTENRLKGLSKQLEGLSSHLDDTLMDISHVASQEKLVEQIQKIKIDIGTAQTSIGEFRSYWKIGVIDWEDGKVSDLTKLMESISNKVDGLVLLENDKKMEQQKLIEQMTSKQNKNEDSS